MSFFSGFFDIGEGGGEHQVLCPFPHHTAHNLTYLENTPSAHVNMDKRLFHCKACGTGLNEKQFVEKILGCDSNSATKILKTCETAQSLFLWDETNTLDTTGAALCAQFGITEDVAKELHLATPHGQPNSLAFPVPIYGQLMDVRVYTPGGKPKVRSRAESVSGMIIPFDIWRNTPQNKITIICAGEKDMAVARSHGFNAITITGGEMMVPRILEPFRGRPVIICYDNDDTGYNGARNLAAALYPYTKQIKICESFHEVCKEPKEDITDFFVKYGKSRADLIGYLNTAQLFEPSEMPPKRTDVPLVTLAQASCPEYVGKLVQSNVQIVAVTDTVFTAPKAAKATKVNADGLRDQMLLNETREWELTEENIASILHLVDSSFKETDVMQHLKMLMKIPAKETGVRLQTNGSVTIYKAYVTDMFETNDSNVQPMEYQVYSVGHRMESGQKYLVTHRIVPHPYKGQQLVMIVTDAVQANDSVSNFKVTQQVKEHLAVFQTLEGSVEDKVSQLTEKVKGLVGYNGNNTLIQAIDFAYHTALQFNLGHFKEVRGYLDTLIVGESRVGKSSTADALRKEYGLGIFTSLAGNSATIPGLIGGSNKTATGFQTRAGVIPQNHRGLVIFEEFGKCKQDIISELTDIRSSNEVRIARVSGTITMPAMVRMIALTNTKAVGGAIKPIATYPNGIAIVTELVPTAEDIARYDMIVILPDRGNSQIDPFWEPETPFPQECYRDRIRWIWSRTADQVVISKEVGLHIMAKANALNEEFDSHIKIFGTEAWKKLSRLAIAVAGYLVSTDEQYENIIVTKEHVDYAEQFLRKIYDNSTFNLREYVQTERMYATTDEEGTAALQDIYNKYPALVLQLEKTAVASKNMLSSASGLTQDDLNKALSRLTKGLFIQYQGYDIRPTERFRKTMALINRNTYTARVGE